MDVDFSLKHALIFKSSKAIVQEELSLHSIPLQNGLYKDDKKSLFYDY
jgi:hypothetical protein